MTLPEEFTTYTRALMGEERFARFLGALDEPAPVSIRVNPFKAEATPETGADRVAWCRGGYYLDSRPAFTFDPLLHAGAYYVQEASSMFIDHVVRQFVHAPVTALDLCAAPGGKTTCLRAALPEGSRLYSNEPHPKRAQILAENVVKFGHPEVVVTNNYAIDYKRAGLRFGLILADMPCSGEGMFRKDPESIGEWSPANVEKCAALQRSILADIWPCLLPGGLLIYSTCTFAPEEDEGQVAAFLQRHPEFTLADVLGNVDYTFGSAGEENRTGGLPLDVSKVRRIWPCQGGEGHFMARLVKAGTPRTLPPEGEYTPEEQLWLAAAAEAGKKGKGKAKPAKAADARSARRADSRACRDAVQGTSRRTRDTGAGEATPAQSLAAWQEFARQYFPALAQRPAVVHGGGVLLPVAFPQTGLHVLRAGVFVGSVQKGRFVPEHHLFTAFGGLCTNCEQLTLADCRCTEYLSGREVEARTAADGWCCVTVDGWPLGGGKVSGGRVKNHYPKALRLL